MKQFIKKIFSPRNLGAVIAILIVGGAAAYAAVPAYKSWLLQGSNLYTTGTNVGIGTTNPGYKLAVLGDTLLGAVMPGFGINGVVNSNPSSNADLPRAIAADANSVYVAGDVNVMLGSEWRIEKRDKITGALDAGFGTGGVVTSNPSSVNDGVSAVEVDASFIYLAGYDYGPGPVDAQWRIEKRDKITGALDAGFGTGGVVTSNFTVGEDILTAIAIDASFIYLVGPDRSSGNDQWRIEKRDIATGALAAGFGTGGVVTSNPSSNDRPWAIAADANSIYVVGDDVIPGNLEWRIEKRDKITGILNVTFGLGGVVTNNPSNRGDIPREIAADASFIYIAGYDGSPGIPGTPDDQWRIEKRDKITGALDAGFGTGGVVTSNPSSFRDSVSGIAADASFIYIAGNEEGLQQRRIEKRDTITGALDLGFGTGGVVISNPSLPEFVYGLAVDANFMYLAGAGGIGAGDWHIEKRDLLTGNLAAGSMGLYVSTSGLVGIGTVAPTNRLSVFGSADVTGNVGIGMASASERLQVAGVIHSTTGGFKFPDGTIQISAATPLVGAGFPNGMQEFASPGPLTFVVPSNVARLFVEVWGAGGGGGGGGSGTTGGGGGGGGAGGYSRSVVTVVSGQSYVVQVGAGGAAGGQDQPGGGGNPSSFEAASGVVLLISQAGTGGQPGGAGPNGGGGAAGVGGQGDANAMIKRSGGNGGNGGNGYCSFGLCHGGSGGPYGSVTAGTIPPLGGNGGNGGQGANNANVSAGGNGYVIIHW